MTTPVLNGNHRCDSCTARAYVRVSVPVPKKAMDCELEFCAHHFGTHEAVLKSVGAVVIVDQRQDLKVTAGV